MDLKDLNKFLFFKGLSERETGTVLQGLGSIKKKYKKGATIFHAGDTTESMGLILCGSVIIENNDIWGNKTILSHVEEGGFFAETYAFLKSEPLLVDVVANEDCSILFINIGKIGNTDSIPTQLSSKLTENLLRISAQKNLLLSGRSFHTAPKTIRGKVMSYLNSLYIQKKSIEFYISFDRQQLADYLNVERTALSKELRKMQNDGLIEFHKNRFIICPDQLKPF